MQLCFVQVQSCDKSWFVWLFQAQTLGLPNHNNLLFAAGRGLQTVRLTVGGASLVAATTHLESPCGHAQMMSAPRVAQCQEVRS